MYIKKNLYTLNILKLFIDIVIQVILIHFYFIYVYGTVYFI